MAGAHDRRTKRFDQLTPRQRRGALGAMAKHLNQAKEANKRLKKEGR